MPLIDIKNLNKTYSTHADVKTSALNDVSLSINDGEFLAIAGPSGSGKSSLLNIIGCLDAPTSGKIIFEEQDLTTLNSHALSIFRLNTIGFIFQAYNLINTLTAFENVEYPLILKGIGPKERQKRSQEILEQVGLQEYIHRFPYQMSGGQQQRVAVARAIVTKPKIIMADEPTANLDSKTSENLLNLMLELNHEKQTTFIFSTHDQSIMDKAKRLIILKDGHIQK